MMTNYEKYKDELIELLAVNAGSCGGVFRLRTNGKTYPMCSSYEACKECELLNKQWLMAEAVSFAPSELKAGEKIIMRKHGNTEFLEFEVVCNKFPACWLRFRASENGIPQANDDDFLIFYGDLLDEYEVREVIRG